MGTVTNSFSRPRVRLAMAAVGAVIVVGVVIFALVLTSGGSGSSTPLEPSVSASPSSSPSPSPSPSPPPFGASPVDGSMIEVGELARLAQRLPLAVMIENDPAARPQSGLNKADLVYEAIAEGGITRFMAVYWRNEAERIEFLRSARIYYIQWASELGAVYVHWGQVEDPGPVDVWPVFARLNTRVLNGLFLGEEVGYRNPDRFAPHKVYTNSGLLWSSAQTRGYAGPPTLQPWLFKDDNAERAADPALRAARVVDVTFGSAGSPYAVAWYYDPATNSYQRSMGGAPHIDGTSGEHLTARNVAVQFATLRPSGVKAYNIIDTVGSGRAVVFQDGIAIDGSWGKDSESARTRFYDDAGNEISFNRGRSWIEVVPSDSAVGY
jgi:Protein of unknown function (DUF3048) N-terminal domain/Protein of unknown function (DUF3048) C-terminal domain